jgi:hypothetical protein
MRAMIRRLICRVVRHRWRDEDREVFVGSHWMTHTVRRCKRCGENAGMPW